MSEPALRAALTGYSAAYEMDMPLWFLGVLGKAYREGRFTPRAFGGPESPIAQAALVEGVATALEGTPLGLPFADAWDPDLRNAVGHNDYVLHLQRGGGGSRIRDRKSGREWTIDEFADRLVGTWDLLQAIEHVVQFMQLVEMPARNGRYADRGIADVGYAVHMDGRPSALIAQLWCFRDVDPAGRWLDSAEIQVERQDDGQEKVAFTERAYSTGRPVLDGPWGEALREWGWAVVRRVPVAPDLGRGFPTYERPDGFRFEIVGESDEHLVRFSPNVT